MDSSFDIKIEGTNVAPSTVALEDLLEILANLRAAFLATAAELTDIPPPSLQMSLTGIGDGSNTMTFTAAPQIHSAAARCARAISTSDTSAIPHRARMALRQLWKKANARTWAIVFVPTETIPRAVIDPAIELDALSTIQGQTTLLCRVLRVGGTPNPTAQIQFEDGGKTTVSLDTENLAQRLGTLLYRTVSIEGEASWRAQDMGVETFRATAIGEFDDSLDIVEGLAELASIAGSHWDDIDPEEYVRELRSE